MQHKAIEETPKTEGAPLLSSTINDDNAKIDIKLKEQLVSEFESNIQYNTNIQHIEQLSFFDEIKKYEKEKKSRPIKDLICSWVICLLFWISLCILIYFVTIYFTDSSKWFLPLLFAIMWVVFYRIGCSITSQVFGCCVCDTNINYKHGSLYTMYSWQRKMSAIQKCDIYKELEYRYHLFQFPSYHIQWTAPDGEKNSESQYFKDPPNKQNRIKCDDISNDLNGQHIDNIYDDIKGNIMQITIYKTYSFKNDEIKNEYIKQGKEFIDEIIKNTDLNECNDIKLKQMAYWDRLESQFELQQPDIYCKNDYYIIDNNAQRIFYKYGHCILMMFGLWSIFDTIIYFKMRSNHKSFVFVKQLKLEPKIASNDKNI